MSQRPQPPADTETDDPKIVVSDPEDFARTRQLRAVFDARDHFTEERRRAEKEYQKDDISDPGRRKRVYQAIQDLVLALEPLIHEHDDAEYYLDNREYKIHNAIWPGDAPSLDQCAQVVPEEYQEAIRRAKNGINPGNTRANPQDRIGNRNKSSLKQSAASKLGLFDDPLIVEGMRSVAGQVLTVMYPIGLTIGGKTDMHIIQSSPPKTTFCVQVFRDCQTILRDLGLGVDLSEAEQQTKITDDLVDEVETWQRNNLD